MPSSFFVSNLFEGIIWFLLPTGLVIINDIAAYLAGEGGGPPTAPCSCGASDAGPARGVGTGASLQKLCGAASARAVSHLKSHSLWLLFPHSPLSLLQASSLAARR